MRPVRLVRAIVDAVDVETLVRPTPCTIGLASGTSVMTVPRVDDIPQRSSRRGDELDDRLLDAVVVAVRDDPTASLTARSLARAAGVDQRVITRRFGDTASLERRALERSLGELRAATTDTDRLPPPGSVFDDPVRWHLMARLALDSQRHDRRNPISEFVRWLVDSQQHSGTSFDRREAEMAVVLTLSIEVGTALFRHGLCKPFALTPDDPVIRTQLISMIEDLRARTGPFGGPAAPLRLEHDRWSRARTKRWRTPTRGRDNVEDRLVHAGATLLVEHRPSTISGRDLAQLAKVNYGLIHQYFGTKDEVLRHSLVWLRGEALRQLNDPPAGGVGQPIGIASVARAMANMALDGLSAAPDGDFPGLDRFVERFQGADTRAVHGRVTAFLAVSAYLAWVLLEEAMEPALATDLGELHAVAMGHLAQAIRSR